MNKNIPWPTIKLSTDDRMVVPLKEEYTFHAMWYLDTPEAKPIFERQADIIIEKQSKGIVDIGARHGPVNKILQEKGYTDYKYMGFDTSVEPIAMAKETWKDHSNIEYRNTSWNNKDIEVDFDVDMVIFSGVLLYEADHYGLFNRMMKLYNAKNAIIQEPYHEQRHYDERLVLKTITQDMDMYKANSKSYKEHITDCELFLGKRLIADICL